jgi:hypothetical protein
LGTEANYENGRDSPSLQQMLTALITTHHTLSMYDCISIRLNYEALGAVKSTSVILLERGLFGAPGGLGLNMDLESGF